MGSCVSTFYTLCIPYNSSPKSILFHNRFLGQQHKRWTLKFPVLTSISDTAVRNVEKWTRRLYVVVFCILVKESVNSYRYSISWILCLYRQMVSWSRKQQGTLMGFDVPITSQTLYQLCHVFFASLSLCVWMCIVYLANMQNKSKPDNNDTATYMNKSKPWQSHHNIHEQI